MHPLYMEEPCIVILIDLCWKISTLQIRFLEVLSVWVAITLINDFMVFEGGQVRLCQFGFQHLSSTN